ncbi:MAG: basal-body rod modification protein flgD [Pseudobdellovibrio sp.]|nr:basal-body rod modification protein flgD [Pseudobdellovibrio sp.]
MTMSVKHNTKTWSDAKTPEREDMAVGSLTPEEKQKIGSDDLRAVLNKAADKNWVDDNKRVAGHGNDKMDKDAFFKLMLAQLKNQDPMNPLKNHEMAAQLAQFSSLEQMSNMNTTLSRIEGKNSKPEQFQALNLIGKTVAGDSSRVVRTNFDKDHDFNFELPQDASDVTVKLMSDRGQLLREFKLTNMKAGANKVSWNGNNESGIKQPAGEYFFQIEARNGMGGKVPVSTQFRGEVSGLSFSAEGPVLQVGSQTIKMKDVTQITDSSAQGLKQNDQNVKNSTSLDLKNDDDTKQTDIKEEANVSSNTEAKRRGIGTADVMSDFAMSNDFMAKLQKEMK